MEVIKWLLGKLELMNKKNEKEKIKKWEQEEGKGRTRINMDK